VNARDIAKFEQENQRILDMALAGFTNLEIQAALGYKSLSTIKRRKAKVLANISQESIDRLQVRSVRVAEKLLTVADEMLEPTPDGFPPSPQAYTAAAGGLRTVAAVTGIGAASRLEVDVQGGAQSVVHHKVTHELPKMLELMDRIAVGGIGSGRSPDDQVRALTAGPITGGDRPDDLDDDIYDAELVGDDDDPTIDPDFFDDRDPNFTPIGTFDLVFEEGDDETPGRWEDGVFIAVWDDIDMLARTRDDDPDDSPEIG
jgi:hypothetical protein